MPKYEVIITEKEIYIIGGIEAEDEDKAKDIAWEMLTDGRDKNIYHHDSDGDAEAYEM